VLTSRVYPLPDKQGTVESAYLMAPANHVIDFIRAEKPGCLFTPYQKQRDNERKQAYRATEAPATPRRLLEDLVRGRTPNLDENLASARSYSLPMGIVIETIIEKIVLTFGVETASRFPMLGKLPCICM
jgi:hypothetical protein